MSAIEQHPTASPSATRKNWHQPIPQLFMIADAPQA
jgi:hypothetical protein